MATRKVDTQSTGAHGEVIVLHELLWRGWLPANVNFVVRNARNVDVVALKGDKRVTLSVKTSGKKSNGNFQLGKLEFNAHSGAKAEYVVFVIIGQKSAKEYRCFVVPIQVAEREVKRAHAHWINQPRRDGKPHSDAGRGIGFFGNPTEANIARGFSQKWAKFEDNWEQLEAI
ncbi:MAG TPA: hypothetical protein VF194_18405 [Ferrovibrio sp.]|uniref:hypothetical protein n=1 Tax=Ferrovibrio sp. TaxID=1917215 RepID=UPI002ED07659